MDGDPKGAVAARLRQRKFELLRRFPIPAEVLPGALTASTTRCGKTTCHCAKGKGHEAFTLTFMVNGKRRVERIPKEWAEQVRKRVKEGRAFQQAVRDILAANAQLLVLARQQRKKPRR
jgi:hypothetical protein